MATAAEALKAKLEAAAASTQIKQPDPNGTLEERMNSVLAEQAGGSAGEQQVLQVSGTTQLPDAVAQAATTVTGGSPVPTTQDTVSLNPQGQKSQARLAEEAAITQSSVNVAHSSGVPMLTPEQLEQAKKQLGLVSPSEQARVVATRTIGRVRTFNHLFAGAGTIMPNGTRLTFGGAPGGIGTYVTDNAEEIAFLEELSRTSGSQVSDPEKHVGEDARDQFRDEQMQALEDARKNTVTDLNPNVVAARAALESTIKQNG